MTIPQLRISDNTRRIQAQARLVAGEHDTLAMPTKIGLALTHLAEAIQTAKRAGVTCEQMHRHLAVLWPVVPVEDADDAGL